VKESDVFYLIYAPQGEKKKIDVPNEVDGAADKIIFGRLGSFVFVL
jgi:hypothetical protein